jgi:hypothetical protein
MRHRTGGLHAASAWNCPGSPFGLRKQLRPANPAGTRIWGPKPGFNAMSEFLPDLNRLTGKGVGKRLSAGLRETNGEKICLPFAQPLK